MKLKILKSSANLDAAKMEGVFYIALGEFETLGGLQGYDMGRDDFQVEFMNNPHKPPKLPQGKMAVLGFFYEDDCLLFGFAGAKSNPRFSSQHYNLPQKNTSSLAGHIVRDEYIGDTIDEGIVGSWIKRNCWRINIYADEKFGTEVMKELCGFLKARFPPRYR